MASFELQDEPLPGLVTEAVEAHESNVCNGQTSTCSSTTYEPEDSVYGDTKSGNYRIVVTNGIPSQTTCSMKSATIGTGASDLSGSATTTACASARARPTPAITTK